MALANVATTDTFDVWRTRTNQIIFLSEQANSVAYNASTVASQAYDKANSANVLAFNTGIGANAYAVAVGAGANAYMISVQNGSNTAVGTGANTYLLSVIAGANTAVGAGANAYAGTVGVGANNYLLTVIAGANTAVGTGANNYLLSVIAGANTAVGAGANNYLLTVIAGANSIGSAAFAKANTVGNTGLTILADTVSATRYVTFVNATSGNSATLNVSSTTLTFNPSTGTLSSTIFSATSDINQKTDVAQITNALDIIKQINGVGFRWKDNNRKSYGVIAQELENILPELVEEADGIKSVNYLGIIAFLIQAVKELNDKITEK